MDRLNLMRHALAVSGGEWTAPSTIHRVVVLAARASEEEGAEELAAVGGDGWRGRLGR